MLSRWMAATLFKKDIAALRASLSLRTCSQELQSVTNNAREPYKEVLKALEARLTDTVNWADLNLSKISAETTILPVHPSQLGSKHKYVFTVF